MGYITPTLLIINSILLVYYITKYKENLKQLNFFTKNRIVDFNNDNFPLYHFISIKHIHNGKHYSNDKIALLFSSVIQYYMENRNEIIDNNIGICDVITAMYSKQIIESDDYIFFYSHFQKMLQLFVKETTNKIAIKRNLFNGGYYWSSGLNNYYIRLDFLIRCYSLYNNTL